MKNKFGLQSMIVTKDNKSYGCEITKTGRVKNSKGMLNWVQSSRYGNYVEYKNNMFVKDFIEAVEKIKETTEKKDLTYYIQNFDEPVEIKLGGFNYRWSSSANNAEVFTLKPSNDNFGKIEICYEFLYELMKNIEIKDETITSTKLHFYKNTFWSVKEYEKHIQTLIDEDILKNSLKNKKTIIKKISKKELKEGYKVDILFKDLKESNGFDYYYMGEFNNLLCISRCFGDSGYNYPTTDLRESLKHTNDIVKTKRFIFAKINKKTEDLEYKIFTSYPYVTKQYLNSEKVDIIDDLDITLKVSHCDIRFKNINSGSLYNCYENDVRKYYCKLLLSKSSEINFDFEITETNDIKDHKQMEYGSEFYKNNFINIHRVKDQSYSMQWDFTNKKFKSNKFTPKEILLSDDELKKISITNRRYVYCKYDDEITNYKEYKVILKINTKVYKPNYILSGTCKD